MRRGPAACRRDEGRPGVSRSFHLTIATPATLLVDAPDVVSIRAEDDSGGFGLLPGHADLLTVTPACVLRWRSAEGVESYCAVRGGVLTVTGGDRVAVACRHGVMCGDLQELEGVAHAARAARIEAAQRARVTQTRLHANALRQLIRYLRPAGLSESVLSDGEGDGS